MNILGISCFYHDAAAALLCDGELVAAAHEERFTRKRHDPDIPAEAVKYCLQEAGLSIDDIDYVADIVKRVGSLHCKLLFDIYHVQVMNGDVIRRVEQYRDLIGHVHTAGNPGRGELDDDQEIHYPATMKKLIEIGYTGYVGQEFIPTRDPTDGLRQAMSLCDV